MNPVLIKIGGHELEDTDFLSGLAAVLQKLAAPVVIVHGGGREISDLQRRLGIEPQYLNGVRITDAESMAVVEMVLCGTVNKRLVRWLVAGGIQALGLSGSDLGLIRARKMPHETLDMAYTGQVTAVRGEVLHGLLAQGITPVLAPVCMGETGPYNVNADHVAGAVAAAVGASRVVFLTNVAAVLHGDRPLDSLTPAGAHALIAQGIINGGMIPKVETALEVLHSGVPEVVITSLQGLQNGGGTRFSQAE